MSQEVVAQMEAAIESGSTDVMVEVVADGDRPLRAHVSATLDEREPDEDTLILTVKEVAALHDLFGRTLASMQAGQPSVEQGVVEKPAAYEVWRSIWSEMGTLEAIADALPESPVGGVLRGYQEHGLPEILPTAEKALRDAGGEPDMAHAKKTFQRGYQITSLLIREMAGEDIPPDEYERDPDEFYASAPPVVAATELRDAIEGTATKGTDHAQ